MNKKVILAYSGGLDTSVILKWLINKNYEVICYIADVGQDEDFDAVKQKALLLGASKVYIEDLKKEFVENYIFTALKANAVYEGKYLLGTSLARPLIAKKQIEIAIAEQTNMVAHGATGKGNDQVRFELTYYHAMPQVHIISPWKMPEFLAQFTGRTDLINYANAHHIPISSTLAKPYSIDENLMHTSYEGGMLEDPASPVPQDVYKKTVDVQNTPDTPTNLVIEFKKGTPVAVTDLATGHKICDSLELFTYLNKVGGSNGVGRVDLVENRFVGLKSRGAYECPAMTMLLKAHLDLEGLVLDKEVFHLKETLMPKIAQLIYNGFWFSPEMAFLMASINQSQEHVEGCVQITIYKGNVWAVARWSDKSLYDQDLSSMDIHGSYDQTDAKGFIALHGLRLKIFSALHASKGNS
ncbi:argininosuccinate synthase [soil metagenome]